MREVVIISAVRTPMVALGEVYPLSMHQPLVPQLLKELYKKQTLVLEIIEEFFMGNVLQANLGQAPARCTSCNVC